MKVCLSLFGLFHIGCVVWSHFVTVDVMAVTQHPLIHSDATHPV